MITTITLNPAIDKIVEVTQMKLGSVHRVQKQVVSLGGKSINVARLLSGFKEDTKAICFAGKGNYDEVKLHAERDRIPIEPIMVDGLTRTNVKVVEPDMDYRTTDINEIGFEITKEKLQAMDQLIADYAKKSEYMVMSGSLPKGVSKDYYKQIAIRHQHETNIIIDADGEILKKGIEGAPYLIKPNIHELEAAYQTTLDTTEKIVKLGKRIIAENHVTYILVSMGEKGSILIGENLVLIAGILKVNVVSTVGAGDSMLAGVIHGLTKHSQLTEVEKMTKALSYGVASSAIAISTQDHVSIEEQYLLETAEKVRIEKY